MGRTFTVAAEDANRGSRSEGKEEKGVNCYLLRYLDSRMNRR